MVSVLRRREIEERQEGISTKTLVQTHLLGPGYFLDTG